MSCKSPIADLRRLRRFACWAAVCGSLLATSGICRAQSSPVRAADYQEPLWTAADREHWAYRDLADHSPPEVKNSAWVRTPVDCFILARLEDRGLTPSPPAELSVLARRSSLDLRGVPPSAEEVRLLLADQRPDAYERWVDRLLASPAYGERWAQHWLDLARFAETDGFEHDKARSGAWKYRDWVIAAFNGDLPYDRFVALQLAGDELQPGDERAAVPTGFCLSGPDMPDINSQQERRHALLNEMTATVGAVFLGLQLGCAQCHDHKYDALSMADFYGLRAFFQPAVELQANRSVEFLRPANQPGGDAIMLRGDWRREGPRVAPRTPQVLTSSSAADYQRPAALRTDFANWIVAQPLAARVIANRVWQHHFGAGLSPTPSDFGVMGEEPSHPELLDWLAVRLRDDQWSLKSLHRLIMTSAVYRQASSHRSADASRDAAFATADPRWLAAFPRRRLDAEAVRDSLLQVAGLLDWRRGGPGVRPPLPPELVDVLLKDQWIVSERPADHYRRSIYVFVRRNLKLPLLESFDRPDANASCARRHESIVPSQALHLMNSPLAWEAARRIAADCRLESAGAGDRVERIFRRVLGRPPSERELRVVLEHAQASPRAEETVLVEIALAVLNSNEFVFVD